MEKPTTTGLSTVSNSRYLWTVGAQLFDFINLVKSCITILGGTSFNTSLQNDSAQFTQLPLTSYYNRGLGKNQFQSLFLEVDGASKVNLTNQCNVVQSQIIIVNNGTPVLTTELNFRLQFSNLALMRRYFFPSHAFLRQRHKKALIRVRNRRDFENGVQQAENTRGLKNRPENWCALTYLLSATKSFLLLEARKVERSPLATRPPLTI